MWKLLEFLRNVVHHWGSLVTSGALIGAITLWQQTGHYVPFWVYWAVGIIGLMVAAYRAWLAENTRADGVSLALKAIQDKRGIRERLGIFLGEGESLQRLCGNVGNSIPANQANEWAKTVETFLGTSMGSEYISRFRSTAGAPTVCITTPQPDRNNLWKGLNVRMFRLNEFLSELKD